MIPDDKLQISNDEGLSLSNESKRRGALQLERHVARPSPFLLVVQNVGGF